MIIYSSRDETLVIKKRVVQHIGRQKDGTWTLGHGMYISKKGSQIADVDCNSVWISNVFEGRGIPDASKSCTIVTPLSTNSLGPFLDLLCKSMKQLSASIISHEFYCNGTKLQSIY